MVRLKGLEPPFLAPEASALSIKLQALAPILGFPNFLSTSQVFTSDFWNKNHLSQVLEITSLAILKVDFFPVFILITGYFFSLIFEF